MSNVNSMSNSDKEADVFFACMTEAGPRGFRGVELNSVSPNVVTAFYESVAKAVTDFSKKDIKAVTDLVMLHCYESVERVNALGALFGRLAIWFLPSTQNIREKPIPVELVKIIESTLLTSDKKRFRMLMVVHDIISRISAHEVTFRSGRARSQAFAIHAIQCAALAMPVTKVENVMSIWESQELVSADNIRELKALIITVRVNGVEVVERDACARAQAEVQKWARGIDHGSDLRTPWWRQPATTMVRASARTNTRYPRIERRDIRPYKLYRAPSAKIKRDVSELVGYAGEVRAEATIQSRQIVPRLYQGDYVDPMGRIVHQGRVGRNSYGFSARFNAIMD